MNVEEKKEKVMNIKTQLEESEVFKKACEMMDKEREIEQIEEQCYSGYCGFYITIAIDKHGKTFINEIDLGNIMSIV